MERCEYTLLYLAYIAMLIVLLDGSHCPILHLILRLGIFDDEAEEQED